MCGFPDAVCVELVYPKGNEPAIPANVSTDTKYSATFGIVSHLAVM
jgi:hypothetical protein